jgi:energy-coupling factor transporter ATP-binding protein EcfA2
VTVSGADGQAGRPGDSRPVIEVRHLTKRYGPVLAVDDLSFTVAAGQVTGFLGPNGSGKSTTMRMIVGLDAPTAGQVTVGGRSYGQLRFRLREVGALLDAGAVHPGRTPRAVTGGAVHLVLIGAIAVALGALMRRTAGAVAVLFAVLLVIPGLVTLLPAPWNNDITRYLPNSAGAAMSAVVRFPNLLSPAGGLIVLCAYTAAALVLAALALNRRDA